MRSIGLGGALNGGTAREKAAYASLREKHRRMAAAQGMTAEEEEAAWRNLRPDFTPPPATDDAESRTSGAPADELMVDPDIGAPLTWEDRALHGLPTQAVPPPRTVDGLPPEKPRQFADRKQSKDYVRRDAADGGVFAPSQRDLDMADRGMVPVFRRDGSIGYAPGMLVGPDQVDLVDSAAVQPDSPSAYVGGVGRKGRRLDLEAAGWRLVEESGPTGTVYVYRPQPPGKEGRPFLKEVDEEARLPPDIGAYTGPAPIQGTDALERGPIVQDRVATPGHFMPNVATPRPAPRGRTGNTYVDSRAAAEERQNRRLARSAGVSESAASKKTPLELRQLAGDRRSAQQQIARQMLATSAQLSAAPSMAEAALIHQMTPEQRARLAAFRAAGGRGASPNDIEAMEGAARNRPMSPAEIIAQGQVAAAQQQEERAQRQTLMSMDDETFFRQGLPAADQLVGQRARALLFRRRYDNARDLLLGSGYTEDDVRSLIGQAPQPNEDENSWRPEVWGRG